MALVPIGQAHAQDVVPPKVYSTTPGGINVSDGTLVYSNTDLALGPLKLERYYRDGPRQPNDPMFGYNFSSNFDIYVARTSGTNATNIVHIGNTASGKYYTTLNGSGIYGSADLDASKGRLTTVGSNYVYTDSSGTIYTFTSSVSASGTPFTGTSQRVDTIDFPDGRRQTFSYTTGGQPRLVEDSSGYAILFDYNAHGDVSAACIFKRSETYVSTSSTCAGAALKTSYTYNSSYVNPPGTYWYYLASFTDVLNQVTTYSSTGTVGFNCLKPPGYSSCTMTLSGTYANPPASTFSRTQTLDDQGTWTISGTDWDVGTELGISDGGLEASVTGPDGLVALGMTFTQGSPHSMTQAGQTTEFKFEGGAPKLPPPEYCCTTWYGGMLREATYPEGDKYLAEYNGPFKSISKESRVPKTGSSSPTLIKQYGYGSCTVSPGTYQNCAKPIWIKDPKGYVEGYQTDYAYEAHGGIKSEMGPAPVVGGARPLKLTTWVQRYAWIKNSSGTLVQNSSFPVWVKDTETQCQTVAGTNPAASCDPAAPQAVTTYEYGANTTGQSLLVKGVKVLADGLALRTCYGYDAFDRKISETQPNAALTSCP